MWKLMCSIITTGHNVVTHRLGCIYIQLCIINWFVLCWVGVFGLLVANSQLICIEEVMHHHLWSWRPSKHPIKKCNNLFEILWCLLQLRGFKKKPIVTQQQMILRLCISPHLESLMTHNYLPYILYIIIITQFYNTMKHERNEQTFYVVLQQHSQYLVVPGYKFLLNTQQVRRD